MGQQKRGRKLLRSTKHANMYAAQVFRTARNKAAYQTRIQRRKAANPSPQGRRYKAGHTKRPLKDIEVEQ